jgi:hypothetical protein
MWLALLIFAAFFVRGSQPENLCAERGSCCTGRSDRYSLTNPQVQDCTVLYRSFRLVQPHQSAGTGLYCAVPAVQTGTASPICRYRAVLYCDVPAFQTGTASVIERYRAVLCCTGRSDRYKLTNRRVQDCTVLYWSFKLVKAHQSAGTGLYCTVLVVQTVTASPIRRYRAVLYCTGRSDSYSLTNPQVQDCTLLYWSFRQVQPHQSAGTGLYCAVPADHHRYSLTHPQVQDCAVL